MPVSPSGLNGTSLLFAVAFSKEEKLKGSQRRLFGELELSYEQAVSQRFDSAEAPKLEAPQRVVGDGVVGDGVVGNAKDVDAEENVDGKEKVAEKNAKATNEKKTGGKEKKAKKTKKTKQAKKGSKNC